VPYRTSDIELSSINSLIPKCAFHIPYFLFLGLAGAGAGMWCCVIRVLGEAGHKTTPVPPCATQHAAQSEAAVPRVRCPVPASRRTLFLFFCRLSISAMQALSTALRAPRAIYVSSGLAFAPCPSGLHCAINGWTFILMRALLLGLMCLLLWTGVVVAFVFLSLPPDFFLSSYERTVYFLKFYLIPFAIRLIW